MKILLVSKFLHHVGGVETYLRWLARALTDAGHDVGLVGMEPPAGEALMDLPGRVWTTPRRSFAEGSRDRVRSAAASVWSPAAGRVMTRALAEFHPDLVHFHGTCYQLTPAVVAPVAKLGLPCVITAHEYKLLCANQTLYDDGRQRICTECLTPSPGRQFVAPIRRGCMKGSRAVSTLGAVETRVAGPVWHRADPLILAPSPFMADILSANGWRPERVRYLDLAWRRADELPPTVEHVASDNVVFLGRLAIEKGADFLLSVWQRVAPAVPTARLRFLGDGDRRSDLERLVTERAIPRVDFLGRCAMPQIQEELSRAAVTVHPAQWHENSPYSVRESLMAGVPAIVSDLGGMPSMVSTETGWVVAHDDPSGWISTIAHAMQQPRAASATLLAAVAARATTAEDHMRGLEAAYAERCTG